MVVESTEEEEVLLCVSSPWQETEKEAHKTGVVDRQSSTLSNKGLKFDFSTPLSTSERRE